MAAWTEWEQQRWGERQIQAVFKSALTAGGRTACGGGEIGER